MSLQDKHYRLESFYWLWLFFSHPASDTIRLQHAHKMLTRCSQYGYKMLTIGLQYVSQLAHNWPVIGSQYSHPCPPRPHCLQLHSASNTPRDTPISSPYMSSDQLHSLNYFSFSSSLPNNHAYLSRSLDLGNANNQSQDTTGRCRPITERNR